MYTQYFHDYRECERWQIAFENIYVQTLASENKRRHNQMLDDITKSQDMD